MTESWLLFINHIGIKLLITGQNLEQWTQTLVIMLLILFVTHLILPTYSRTPNALLQKTKQKKPNAFKLL